MHERRCCCNTAIDRSTSRLAEGRYKRAAETLTKGCQSVWLLTGCEQATAAASACTSVMHMVPGYVIPAAVLRHKHKEAFCIRVWLS